LPTHLNVFRDAAHNRFKMECTMSMNDMVKDAYPHGMAQPCVLAVVSDDAQDEGSVLFKWSRWQVRAQRRAEWWRPSKWGCAW